MCVPGSSFLRVRLADQDRRMGVLGGSTVHPLSTTRLFIPPLIACDPSTYLHDPIIVAWCLTSVSQRRSPLPSGRTPECRYQVDGRIFLHNYIMHCTRLPPPQLLLFTMPTQAGIWSAHLLASGGAFGFFSPPASQVVGANMCAKEWRRLPVSSPGNLHVPRLNHPSPPGAVSLSVLLKRNGKL